MSILKYLAKLSEENDRLHASKELAKFLNAEDLIIFIEDPEILLLLPAPGFPQILPNGKEWKSFLNSCNKPNYKGTIQFFNEEKTAIAIRFQQTVVVLTGGEPDEELLKDLQDILPVINALLKQELAAVTTKGIATVAAQAAQKAEKLAHALDQARKQVLNVLEENAQLIKTLRIKNDALVKTNNDLDNFIYTASHDLKAPVSNIEGLIHALSEMLASNENEETKLILEHINNSISKFKETIGDLGEITKIQRDTEDVPEEVNLQEIMDDLKILLARPIQESKAFIYDDLKNIHVNFSKKNIRSILYNLLSNAIKYRSPERTPEVKITAVEEGNFIKITVSDNGLGLKKESLNKLFSMFKRFHNHVEGSGVGLYIVKRIIENAEGRIEVESELGKGTTFHVFLKKAHHAVRHLQG